MKFTLIRFTMACIWILCAYKWADWKNWKKYYPSMLFYGMCDLIYISIFHDKPLWRLETDFLILPLDELFVIFTIFFSATILFLSNFPDRLPFQIIYIIFWVVLYTGIELLTHSIGMLKDYNGWNTKWSILFDFVQFPIVSLHYKYPVLAWVVVFVFLGIIMTIFKVPFTIK